MAAPTGPRTSARFALVACSLTLAPMTVRAGDAVRVNGCGSCLAVLRPLLAAQAERHRGVAVEMRAPLGSSGSMLALLAGALDLAVIGRPLRAEEVQQGARGVPYGRTHSSSSPTGACQSRTSPRPSSRTSTRGA
jgi:ABC-type nitrate/sulfonate/bicarbonate transport system substrate-binding protein